MQPTEFKARPPRLSFRHGLRPTALCRLLAFPCLLALVACEAPQPEAVQENEYLLIDQLEGATEVEAARHELSVPSLEVGFDQRRTLLQHPPSVYRFPEVPHPAGARLQVAPVLNPRSWNTKSDGVSFELLCQGADSTWQTLLNLQIDPVANPADRVWHDQDLSLEPCASPTTTLELRTECGQHCAADWAGWGNPKVTWQSPFEPRPERLVLLVSIDTLRPDRLEPFGGRPGSSPHLQRLAADSVAFETAVASTSWTIPSHATMLTSSDPEVHGANSKTPIPEGLPLISEVLADEGWQTAAFVDSLYVSSKFGFDQGFEHFDDQKAPPGNYRRGAAVNRRRLMNWLNTAADERPTFVFWHLMDVHGPYGAPAPHGGKFRQVHETTEEAEQKAESWRQHLLRFSYHEYLKLERFFSLEDLSASYDEGIAAVDAELGRLFDALRQAGLYDDALIVVTSDHGESFLDHDIYVGHGLFATDDEIRVPLLMKFPGNEFAGRRVERLVGLIDLAPSILDALNIDIPRAYQGQSLVSPAPGAPGSVPRVVHGLSTNTGARDLRTNEFKYIRAAEDSAEAIFGKRLRAKGELEPPFVQAAAEQLYDLRSDPGEQDSLIERGVTENLELFRLLVEERAEDSRTRREALDQLAEGAPELSPEDLDRLRSLGYVD